MHQSRAAKEMSESNDDKSIQDVTTDHGWSDAEVNALFDDSMIINEVANDPEILAEIEPFNHGWKPEEIEAIFDNMAWEEYSRNQQLESYQNAVCDCELCRGIADLAEFDGMNFTSRSQSPILFNDIDDIAPLLNDILATMSSNSNDIVQIGGQLADMPPNSPFSPKPGPSHRQDFDDDHQLSAAIMPEVPMHSFEPENHYVLKPGDFVYCKKFETVARGYNVTFKHLDNLDASAYYENIISIFDSALAQVTLNMKPHDMVRFHMGSASWKRDINFPFMQMSDITGKRILSEFMKTDQSNGKTGLGSAGFVLNIIHTIMPEPGSGWSHLGSCQKCAFLELEKWLAQKRCAITAIHNDDHLCMARALVVAMAHYKCHEPGATVIDKEHYKQVSHPQRQHQLVHASQLCIQAGVDANRPCGLQEAQKFQDFLKPLGYRLYVYSAEANFSAVFVGPETCTKRISLLLYKKHFVVLTSMPAFYNTSYFCWDCLKGVNHINKHKCGKKCNSCSDEHCHAPNDGAMVKCETCNRFFKGNACLRLHIGNGTCERIQRCRTCSLYIYTGVKHDCGKRQCMSCKEMVDRGHLCYMQKPKIVNGRIEKRKCTEHLDNPPSKKQKRNDPDPNPVIYYFDTEAIQESQVHKVNLVVVQHEDGLPEHQFVFKNDETSNARDKFCDWVFKELCGQTEKKQQYIFIAHYMKGYDGFFILEYLYNNDLYTPDAIFMGNKMMTLSVNSHNVKFIDSFNFLAMPLSKFPQTFELNEMKKGYFPHYFNTVENQQYHGPMPSIEFYNPDSFITESRETFLKWHSEQVALNYIFDMPIELEAYCISDVNILREGCQQFRTMCKAMFDLDPFLECITIASYCQLVYRCKFMPENSIAVIPAGGYGGRAKQSAKAIRWLGWIGHNFGDGDEIQHARNGGEVKLLGKFYADGFQQSTNTVFEFHGCYFHGCPKCFTPTTENAVRRCSMGEAYASTLDRSKILKEKFNVVEIWECQFEHLLKTDEELRTFVDQHPVVEKLDPREAFFGGRTNAAKLHYKAREGEKISYYDYVSLYPTINKYGKLPIGHPKIITPIESYIPGKYYGFLKCKVLPPRQLFHPVLPYRSKDRLLFPLCRKCADDRQTQTCVHSIEDRALLGTWITPEIDRAIGKGYKVLDAYEVWHFEKMAQYDSSGQSEHPEGLFGGYVNTLLKIKQEASGWPSCVSTDEAKTRFREEYREKEGIILDHEKIKVNPGLRTIAKLMLNSLWGKFGQRENLPSTEYVTTLDRYMELLISPELSVTDAHKVNEEMMMVTYKPRDDFIVPSGRTNIIIAAFTTGLARLKLLDLLERLGRDALYMDTDSVIFKHLNDHDPLEDFLGENLGNLTNEIKPGLHITEFVSGGPKNYGYMVSDGTQVWKVCGLTQNFKMHQTMGFDVIKSMVMAAEDAPEALIFHDTEIVRDKYTGTLQNRQCHKTYKFNFQKGIVADDMTVYPYGYHFT